MEKLKELIKKIKNLPVIVEGINDQKALEALGVSKLFVLSKTALFEVAEEIAKDYEECVILTDLDKKGKELYSKLDKNLQRLGVKINNDLRNYLFKETQLRQIEGLVNYINKKELQ